MMKVRLVLAATLLVVATAASAPYARAQSLADALIAAYRNSPQLKAEQANLRATDEFVAQAWSALRPTLNASVSSSLTHRFLGDTSTWGNSLTLSSDLLLWDGGNTELAVEVNRLNVQAGRQTLADLEQTVLLNAAISFMDMHRDLQNLELAENNRDVLEQQLKADQDRFEVGEIRRTDVSQTEARLAGAQSTVALRQGSLEITRETYHVAVGVYPGNLRNPPNRPALPSSLEAAKSIALRTHPILLRAQTLVEIARLNVLRADAAMKPRFSLSTSVGINANGATGDTASVSIGATVPIYQGGLLASKHRQALALEEKARADLQRAAQVVAQSVTIYWRQLEIAEASIIARQKEVRASRVALRGIREEASLGARTTLDILDAEQALVVAETNLAAARRDENVAVYSLLSAMGLMTARHLGLGIKTYDENENYKKVSTAPPLTDRKRIIDGILKRAGRK